MLIMSFAVLRSADQLPSEVVHPPTGKIKMDLDLFKPGLLAQIMPPKILSPRVIVGNSDQVCITMFDLRTFTLIHVVISLLAIASGFVVVIGLIARKHFQKVPEFRDLAPAQSPPPVAIAQLVALVTFIVLGVLAGKRFGDRPVSET